jgi:hypothetical protein
MSEEIQEARSEKLSSADKNLIARIDNLENNSLETLESAARQLITLCSTLLGTFFALLAFKDMPKFTENVDIKILSALILFCFFIALLFALRAILPKPYNFPRYDLSHKRATLEKILSHKRRAVKLAAWSFGIAALLMLITAINILMCHIP